MTSSIKNASVGVCVLFIGMLYLVEQKDGTLPCPVPCISDRLYLMIVTVLKGLRKVVSSKQQLSSVCWLFDWLICSLVCVSVCVVRAVMPVVRCQTVTVSVRPWVSRKVLTTVGRVLWRTRVKTMIRWWSPHHHHRHHRLRQLLLVEPSCMINAVSSRKYSCC